MTPCRPCRLYLHIEEPSMKVVLDNLLPILLGRNGPPFQIIDHGSKSGLLNNLSMRLAGYARRLEREDIRVLVLLDRDEADCLVLKRSLEDMARRAGLATKSAPQADGGFRVVNRIVVEELEAWFFGDVPAICSAYPGVPASLGLQARYRDPDAIKGGTWEALLRVLQGAGHYVGSARLPKIEVARTIASHMLPEHNRSASFRQFLAGLAALTAGCPSLPSA